MQKVKSFASAEVNALSAPEAAKVYIQHGLAVVPDKPKSKQPAAANWLNLKIGLDDVNVNFHADSNVSILPGKPSAGLVCVDIDHPLVLELVAYLIGTPCIHGRAGMPKSHYWYVVEEGSAQSVQFKHPSGPVLAEILGDKRKVTSPPSVHESGEKIVWEGEGGPPTHTMYVALKGVVGLMCSAALLAMAWPSKGSRNEAALALAGMLLKSDMDVADVEQFIYRVAKAAKDEEFEARAACAKATAAKMKQGEPITAAPRLAELMGHQIVERAKQWLNFKDAIGLADSLTLEGELNTMNEKHAVVQLGGTAAILNLDFDPSFGRMRPTFSKPADLRLRYQNKKFIVPNPLTNDPELRSIADIWLDHPGRRQFAGIEFNPQETTPGYWNRFHGFAVAAKEGDCSLFLEHIKNVICAGNEQHYGYVIRWMAHAIQKPEERPETALVLRGKQGVGKGVFVDNFGALFGQNYLVVYKDSQITGRFNSHLMDALLIHLNEATWGGHKDAAGTLKGLITDPTIPIEAKGKDIFTVKNHSRVIVASNEAWAVPIDLDDRRFLVLEVSDVHKEDHAYFEKLVGQMKAGGGLEALMFHLKTLDLVGFNVRKVPFSSHAFDLKLRSAESHVQWWFHKLKETQSEAWATQVVKAQLHEEYRDWCSKMKMQHPLNLELFARQLRKLVPTMGTVKITQTNVIPAGVRVNCFKLPALAECRQFMQEAMKANEEVWA